MEEFTKLMLSAIADSMTKNGVDNYGNTVNSPINNYLYKWMENNRDELIKAVGKQINIDEIARKVAENIVKEIERFGGSMPYNTEKFKGNLDALVMDKLAQRIASTIKLPAEKME